LPAMATTTQGPRLCHRPGGGCTSVAPSPTAIGGPVKGHP
jgi:hypothetical protein